MDQNSQIGVNAGVFLSFPTLRQKIVGQRMEVIRAHHRMETARIDIMPDYVTKSTSWTDYLVAGTPLLLEWTGRGKNGAFHGYIHTVDRRDDGWMTIICVGVEWPLHNSPGRAFSTTTHKEVISRICLDHHLRHSTDSRAPFVLNVVQGDLTDWKWLVKVAVKEGLSCHFRGATLLAQTYDTIINGSISPALDVEIPAGGMMRSTHPMQYSVRSFKHIESSIVEGQETSTSMYGFMTRDGYVANAIVGTERPPQMSLASMSTPWEARENHTEQDAARRWDSAAEIVMDGDPAMYPLDVIRTRSVGARAPEAVWAVTEAVHLVDGDDYTVRCKLGQEKHNPALLSRPADQVNPFLWKVSKGWYSQPVLRPHGDFRPGSNLFQNYLNYRWTAESVNVR